MNHTLHYANCFAEDNLRLTPSSEPIPKQAQIKTRPALNNQVAKNLSDHTGEFEPVTGTGTGNQNLRIRWMNINEEMAIGRVRVETNGRGSQRAVRLRQKPPHNDPHGFDFFRCDLSLDIVRTLSWPW
jgi:hypothetical protein